MGLVDDNQPTLYEALNALYVLGQDNVRLIAVARAISRTRTLVTAEDIVRRLIKAGYAEWADPKPNSADQVHGRISMTKEGRARRAKGPGYPIVLFSGRDELAAARVLHFPTGIPLQTR